jgi:O-antigen ligase/Tfp pilus assembly protein PilF
MSAAAQAHPPLAELGQATGASHSGTLNSWLVPSVTVLLALVCSPALGDSFELPKLCVLQVGLAILLVGLARKRVWNVGVLLTAAGAAALVYGALNALASVFSYAPLTSLIGDYGHDQGLLTVTIFVTYFLVLATTVRTETGVSRIAWAATVASAAVGAYAVCQQFGLDPLDWPAEPADFRRTFATIGHPNALGEYLALSLPFTLWLVWRGRGLRRDLAAWSLLPQILAVAFTGARTAAVVVLLQVVGGGFLLICARQPALRPLGRVLAYVPMVVPGLAVAVILFGSSVTSVLDAAATRMTSYRGGPSQTRHYLWQSALELVGERPLLGWGPDTFQLAYPTHRSVSLDEQDHSVGRDDSAHNVLLTIGVNAGLLGLAAYLVLQFTMLRLLAHGAFAHGRAELDARRVTAVFLVVGLSTYSALYSSGESRISTAWLFWLSGGLAVGLFGVAPVRSLRPGRVMGGVLVGLAIILAAGASLRLAADLAFARGDDFHDVDELEQAVPWLEGSILLWPLEPAYREGLGLLILDRGRESHDPVTLAAAAEHLTAASKLSGDRDAYLLMQAAVALQEQEEANGRTSSRPIERANEAIRLDPLNPLLHSEVARLAHLLGQDALAVQAWATASELSHSPDAFKRLGEVALALGKFDAARGAFKDAAARETRQPLQADIYRAWADAADLAGVRDEAVSAYKGALERVPDDDDTRVRYARALFEIGRLAEARDEVERVLAVDPTNDDASQLWSELTTQR